MRMEDEIFVPDIRYLVFRKCPADWRVRARRVSNWDITYIIRGKARYIINHMPREISAGELLCLPENTRKEAITYSDHPMHCFSVNFTLKNPEGKEMSLPFPLVNAIGLQNSLIRLFNELVYTQTERRPGYLIKSRGLLLLLLHRLFELTVYKNNSAGGDYRIQKATRYIAQHYAEPLRVKKLAAITGLNAAYFGVLFKQVTGFTVKQYVAQTRVQSAKNLLQSGGYRVLDAAEACGYCDMFYFYKQFKAIMGFPPSQCIPKADRSSGLGERNPNERSNKA